MRVLHVNDYCLLMGGAETYVDALIRAQREAGYEVALMASDSRGGSTLSTFPRNSPPFDSPAYVARGTSSSLRGLRAMRQLYNLSAKHCAQAAVPDFAPDVIHVHMYLGQLSPAALEPFLKADIPLIHTSHTYKVACPKADRMLPNGSFCTFRVGKACVQNCSLVLFVHHRLRESLFTLSAKAFRLVIAPGATMAKILEMEGFPDVRILPYGSTFEVESYRRPPEGEQVLFVGRLNDTKGVSNLIDAFCDVQKHFPNARLVLAGDGPARAKLESQARSRLAECSFEFLGTVTAEQVKSLQDQSRLQCVPSIWPDNSPLVIYESLSRGLPLVASRTGGIPDLIRSEQEGLLVPPGDVQALSDKICQLLGDDVLCARLSQAALTRAKEFSMETHIEKLGTIYAEVVGVGRA